MIGLVYKVVNKINNKCYIGQTTQSLKRRMYNHKYDALNNTDNSYFHNAIRKYGWESFKWIQIYKCNSLDDLFEKEQYFINKFNSLTPTGYNLTLGGSGRIGYKCSEETKKQMRGRVVSEQTRARLRVASIGRKHSEKTKEKISMSLQRHTVSDETRKKISKSIQGKSSKYNADILVKVRNLKEKGFTQKEISTLLNIPLPTIKNWYKKLV